MARPLRIEAADAWVHLTARGNERKPIFRDDADRRQFLDLLGEMSVRFAVRVAAYVLMDNHYHVLARPSQRNLSRAMQWLGVSYTVWFNRRHRRAGHLFQGRFKSVVLEEGAAAEVSRYVHLNPVRVRALGLDKAAQPRARQGMIEKPSAELVRERVRRLRESRWSSYRAYVGLERGPDWLESELVLRLVSGAGKERAQWFGRYREYVETAVREGLLESPWERLEAQVLLGGKAFVARMRKLMSGDVKEQTALRRLQARTTWEQVVAAVEKQRGEPWAKFRDRHGDWGRDAVLHLARKRCGLTLRELGELAGGMDYRSVASALAWFERRLREDAALAKRIEKLSRDLQNNEM
jgi:REP element-mobilizing transposase RayT